MTETPTRICGQPASDGSTFCKNHVTQWFEGHGWRCRHHMPDGMTWPHSRRGLSDREGEALPPLEPMVPPPNDARIESVEDANALIGWATRELAMGRIPESRCRGVINGANRYIRNINEIDAKERLDQLEKAARDAGLIK